MQSKPSSYAVSVGGKDFQVDFKEGKAIVNGKTYDFTVDAKSGVQSTSASQQSKASIEIKAKMPGKILSIPVAEGTKVNADEVLLKMEALKMEMNVVAPQDGTIQEICVTPGTQVIANQVLVRLT